MCYGSNRTFLNKTKCMMQIISCKQCGKSNIGFGETTVTVNYSTITQCCEICHSTKNEEISNYFCSERCFEAYYIHDTALAAPKHIIRPNNS